MPDQKVNTKFLDGLRAIAAVYVMIGHARWLLWEGYTNGYTQHPASYSSADKFLMYFFSMFKYGHQFVMLFFVLSGFVIHLNYANKLKADRNLNVNILSFYYKRVKRIYPPFLFALFLTFILDTVGKACNFTIYSGHTPYSLLNQNVGGSAHSIATFFGNVLFLFNEYVPLFGTNTPAWSLKLEWWFYLFYPLFLLASRKHIFFSSIVVLLLYIAAFFPHIWPEQLLKNVFANLLCWWLGVLLAEVVSGRLNVKIYYYAGLCLTGFAFLEFVKSDFFKDLQTALLFAFIIALLFEYNKGNQRLRLLERLKPISDFSYTLYIIHFPILVFLSGLIMRYNSNVLPLNSYFVIAGAIICLAISYWVHFLVELPFIGKKFIEQAVTVKRD